MPLIHSKTEEALEKNIETLIKEGKPRDQAVAIAKDVQTKASDNHDKLYAQKPYVAQVIQEGPLHDGERLIPLDDEKFKNNAFSSLIEGVKKFKPSVLKEHDWNGESFGYIDSLFEEGGKLFAKMFLNKETAKEMESGKLRWVSPTVHWNAVDDTGERRDARLLEVSFVSVPRNSTRQIPLTELNVLGMDISQMGFSPLFKDEIFISQFSVPLSGAENNTTLEEITDMDMEQLKTMIKEVVGAHMESVKAELMEMVSSKMAEDEESKEEEVKAEEEEAKADAEEAEESDTREAAAKDEEEADKEELSKMSEDLSTLTELAEAKAKIAELEATISTMNAVAMVESDLKTRPHLSSMKEKLVEAAKKDAEFYKGFISAMPTVTQKSQLSQRLTADAQPTEVKDVATLAREIEKSEGVSYGQALRLAQARVK